MQLPQIGFSLEAQYALPTEQVLALLHNAGFSAVSPVRTSDAALAAIAAGAEAYGITLQSLHGPTTGIPLLWQPDAAEMVLQSVLQSLDACVRFGIPVLVMHGWQGLGYAVPDTPDFRCFDAMVDHADRAGVRIAFENLEGEEYLAALLNRYHHQSHVGFCWDSGHDRCYPHRLDFLQEFGDRLMMTHLNDNFGVRDPLGVPTTKDDLHYLPFDGDQDWTHTLSRLSQAHRQEILNFELKIRTRTVHDNRYDQLPLAQFFREAGIRAQKIANQYAHITNQAP